MPVTLEENAAYREFVTEVAQELGVFDVQGEQILWHYTDGAGFLGILQSGKMFATQVSALNDSMETRYATDLFKEAVARAVADHKHEVEVVCFLNTVLEIIQEEPNNPVQGVRACFINGFGLKL